MAELKVYLSDSLNEKFRRAAMSVYGYGRGSISKAAEAALTRWCVEHEPPATAKTADSFKGDRGQAGRAETGIDPDERKKTRSEHEPTGKNDSLGQIGSSS